MKFRSDSYRPRIQTLENRRVLAAATNLAEITGTLYDDLDFDNQVDAGETRIAGATVDLVNPANGNTINSAVTNSAGEYTFAQLMQGSYIVRQRAQTINGRTLVQRSSSTITIGANDVTGVLVTTVDNFSTTTQTAIDDSQDGVPVTSQELTTDAIGGQRDLVVNRTSDFGQVELTVNSQQVIAFDSDFGGDGERRIIWDGIDNEPLTVDDTGLNVDLNENRALGLNLVMGTDVAGSEAIVRVYSNDSSLATASRYSEARIPIPVTTPGTNGLLETVPEYVAFSTAFANVGGGADFNNVTAIELEIDGTNTTNGIAELIGAFAPRQFVQNFDNFDEAELALTKTVDNASPNVGDIVTYTIALRNNGPATATSVQVTDQLPAGVDFVSSSAGTGFNANTGVWTVGTVAVGQANEQTLTITARVQQTGTQINQANISRTDQTDQNANNNTASVDFTPQQIDLELNKTLQSGTLNVGDTAVFVLTLNNNQPQPATSVQVRDVLPTGLRIVDATNDVTASSGNYNVSNGVWDVGTVAGNDNQTLTIRALVETAGSRINAAEVIRADQRDTDSTPGDGVGDDFSSVTFATAEADLELTKIVSTTTPSLRDNVNFTITLTNQGPDTASGVTVLDQLPEGLTFLSSSDPAGYSPGSGVWSIGALSSGSSRSLTIQASVDTIGDKTNTARVESSSTNDSDSTPGNNIEVEDDQASVLITPIASDLSLTKSANNLTPDVGETVRFQITVTNSGPTLATGVSVLDRLPSGTQFVSASYAPGSGRTGQPDFDASSGIWTLGDLPVGAPLTLNLDTIVTGTGFQQNVAEVFTSDQPDTDSTPNNQDALEDDQDDARVRPRLIDLTLNKTVNNFAPSVGDEIEFVITVNNTGDDAATGVQVTESLPSGVTLVRQTPSRGSYNTSTGVWTIGTVGINDPVTLTLRTRVDTIGMGSNRAEVTAADQRDIDSTPNNGVATEDDQASIGFTTETADLALTKTVDVQRPNAGDMVSFDLRIQNQGPDDATAVQVTDLLPTGLTYVSNSVSEGIYNPSSGVWTIGNLPAPTERQTIVISSEVNTATTGTLNFTQVNSPAEYQSAIASFQADPLDETANALVALGYVRSQFQLRQVARNDNPDGVNVEIRFLGAALEGVDVPRINVASNVNTAVNTQTFEDGVVNSNAFATLRINAIVDTASDVTNIAEITAAGQTDPDSTPAGGQDDEDDRAIVQIRPQSIDLSLTKQTNVQRPNPGDEVTFVLSVTNSGQDPATGVQVTDSLPAGLTFVRSNPASDYDAVTGIWNVGNVGVGSSESLEIIALATSSVAETNAAEITAADQRDIDSTPGNGEANEDDIDRATVTPATADLSLTKVVDDNTPNVGDAVVFTIMVSNAGPDPATNVQIRDQLPSGMTLTTFAESTGTYDASSGVWSISDLAVGQGGQLTLTASVDSVDEKTNIAQVIASDQLDSDSEVANDDATEDDQASALLSPELIDLALSKSASNENPNIGDVVTFEVQLTNEGPSTATGVAVLDLLPDGLTFQSSRRTRGVYDPNTGIWNVGSIAVGETPTLEIEAVVQAVTSTQNIAQVNSTDQPDSDSTPGNSEAGEDDQAAVTLMTQVADLSITKEVDNATPGRSDEVTFTIRVTNEGPNDATDVVIQDQLPAGLRFVSADTGNGVVGSQYDSATGRWTLPTVPAGQFQQLELVAAITNVAPSTNIAEIISSRQIDPDSTPGNGAVGEDDIATANVAPRVIDVSVTASTSNDSPLEGETIQLAFTATNDGPDDASQLEFRVPLPDGLTLVTSQPQSGTYNANTGRWIVGNLASGEATRLVLNVRIDQRGIKNVPIELVSAAEFDIDSTPDNDIAIEDDQESVVIKAPRLLDKRRFLSR